MEGKVGGGVDWVRRKSRQEAGDALADVLPKTLGIGSEIFLLGGSRTKSRNHLENFLVRI